VGYDAPVLTSVPDLRVTARNTSLHSANKIHDDEVARRFGFRGGLVPGATVYAYMTRPLVAALGSGWLERGSAAVRFVKPIYEGEAVTLRTSPAAGDALEVRALNPAGEPCALLTAGLAAADGRVVVVADYPRRDLPGERPPATREVLESLDVLGSPELCWDEAAAAATRERFDDADLLYRGPAAWLHPAVLLDLGNRALDQNVRLGPWIHTASEVRHLGPARLGDRLIARGRVARLYEKKGNELVELDLLVTAGEARPVARLRHTAIYRLREA